MDDAAAATAVEPARETLIFEALMRRAAPALERFLARRTGSVDEAEDLAQEAWLRLWRSGRTDALDNADAFLQSIAANLLRDRARRQTSRRAALHVTLEAASDIASSAPDPARALEMRQTLARYQAAVDRLRPKTRTVFLLHRLDGLTYAEIAERLGVSVSAVEKHMMKAILHLDRVASR